METVYLDYNASTPIDAEVADYMAPLLRRAFGNPSSSHSFGNETRKIIEESRVKVARLLNCLPHEVIFTSGGTESNNLAIRGAAYAGKSRGAHIITTTVEHPAVLEVCRQLGTEGFEISYLGVTGDGLVDVNELAALLRSDTILVSIMHANNETGTIQPIEEVARILHQRDVLFHTDAAQSVGKIPVDTQLLKVDLLSVAGHKFYAPKGVGALYVKEGTALVSLMKGASHERNLRPGTENVLEIAGLGKAAEIALRDFDKNTANMLNTRDLLYSKLSEALPGMVRNGHPVKCLPNTLNLRFPGIDSSTLLPAMEKVAVSAGAACHAENISVSHVLEAMGLDTLQALGSLRLSTGKNTTVKEIEDASGEIIKHVRLLAGEAEVFPEQEHNSMDIKLTRFTHGMGCACKISPAILEEVLRGMPVPVHPDILVGSATSDDAAVYRLDQNTAIVQTVDFFTPVVDDPKQFGAIAAANALSDIYAMGAKPLFALNIVAFPNHRLPLGVLKDILAGAEEVAGQAGIPILGGHTIEDNEPKFGMVVCGMVHPDKIWRNSTAKAGDKLLLTKPLGTGILSTALKRGLCSREQEHKLVNTMTTLNAAAAKALNQYPVSACTDVTGFGLLGHLLEMCTGSGLGAVINAGAVPVLEGVYDFASRDLIPGGTKNNLNYVAKQTVWGKGISQPMKYILADAQTSGGLLISVPANAADRVLDALCNEGVTSAKIIGTMLSRQHPVIEILD
jgi:selenium donor protein